VKGVSPLLLGFFTIYKNVSALLLQRVLVISSKHLFVLLQNSHRPLCKVRLRPLRVSLRSLFCVCSHSGKSFLSLLRQLFLTRDSYCKILAYLLRQKQKGGRNKTLVSSPLLYFVAFYPYVMEINKVLRQQQAETDFSSSLMCLIKHFLIQIELQDLHQLYRQSQLKL
jgi:hypothetical protein